MEVVQFSLNCYYLLTGCKGRAVKYQARCCEVRQKLILSLVLVGVVTIIESPSGFFPGIFSGGILLSCKFLLLCKRFVMLISLLFSNQISGGAKVSERRKLPQGEPPLVEEIQSIDPACVSKKIHTLSVEK